MHTLRTLYVFLFLLFSFCTSYATELSGRLSLRYFNIDNRLNGDINAPALRLRMNVTDLFAPGLNFYVYYRGEKDLEGNRITKSRLYDMRLRADNLKGGFGLEAGRINSSVVGAYGILDGISLKQQIKPWLTTGTFFGAEPDLLTFQLSDEIKRAGVFMQLDYGRRYQGTLSAIRQSYLNKMDRFYLYCDNDIELSDSWSFSQFAEVDMKKRVGEDVENALHFTNVFADLRFSPSKIFNTTISYNSRKEYKYLESMSYLPDSLFDSAVSESYGMRANLRPLKSWRAYASARLGERYDEAGYEKFAFAGLANNNFFSPDMFFNVRYAMNWGYYASSNGLYVSLERRLSSKIRLLSSYYESEFKSETNDNSLLNRSVDMVLIYNLSWRLYCYLKATRSWGTDINENRYFVEISYNIRKYNKKQH